MPSRNRDLFTTLLREEWRLHAELFGGRRFLAFPFVVVALTAAAGVGLALAGTAHETVLGGLRVLALGFGLYAGTAGLVGSDMLDHLLDDVSLVLETTETLPLSPRRLLAVFLVKDGLFYAAVFLLPMAIGTTPLELAASAAAGGVGDVGVSAAVDATGIVTVLAIVGFWLELTVCFAFGMAVTVGLIALRTRSVPGWLLGLVLGALVVGGWMAGLVQLVVFDATPGALLAVVTLSLLVGAGSLVVFDSTYRPPARTATPRFHGMASAMPGVDGALVSKSVLELGRSGGGFWKPLVSVTLLLAVVVGLVRLIETVLGIEPASGVFFGSVLALSAFTSYNWLTQYDSLTGYLVLPVAIPAVFRAKRRAFLLIGLPTALLAYVVALVAFPTTLVDAVLGAVLCVGLSLYFFGVTVAFAGFDPNEFLFDAVRFAGFGLAVAVVLVPVLLGSFLPTATDPPTWLVLAGFLAAVALAVAGYTLVDRAGPRWERILGTA